MKRLVIGILAHVDAGKTTLSEAILYVTGTIRKLGRVDKKDAFLDTYALERARGITIFSKQAVFGLGDTSVTLLDTPGHVDFSAEMERTLQVLDYAILVINGADGVQGHTETLWRLLKRYHIPVFLFVNKMDQPGTDREALLENIRKRLDSSVIDFSDVELSGATGEAKVSAKAADRTGELRSSGTLVYSGNMDPEEFYEELAMCDETLMENYLETAELEADQVRHAICERKLFPCYFGSALKLTGVEEFLKGIETWAKCPDYGSEFGAKVFKISRDDQGNRLTHLKITGGSLKVKSFLAEEDTEKINQIRVYSGAKFEAINEAEAGAICAVTGPALTKPGQGYGVEKETGSPLLEPVLTYQVILPSGYDAHTMLKNLRMLEEEDPQLHIVWNEVLSEIQAQVMGDVQMEILKSQIKERFHVDVEFGSGNIVYKETIARPVEGVGHYEPLRHYAEVHLLMEPLEPGSGLVFEADCSEDDLALNWQRLIMTHLEEKRHRGVLTGSEITDMKITIVAGRAHLKHTEGGDFRQSTYRAVRQGLKEAGCRLLEPYYAFRLEVPSESIGRAMADVERMQGKFDAPKQEGDMAILEGNAPVVNMRDYQREVVSYTKGRGRLICSLKGYEPCHNEAEVVAAIGYDFDMDFQDPAGSVFCSHGAGFVVPWDEVKNYMHVESPLAKRRAAGIDLPAGMNGGSRLTGTGDLGIGQSAAGEFRDEAGGTQSANSSGTGKNSGAAPRLSASYYEDKELEEIFKRTYGESKRQKQQAAGEARRVIRPKETPIRPRSGQEEEYDAEYLLVDGYNIIFAWEELNELAKVNIDGARYRLMDILCNYQGYKKCILIVVFDAYKVVGNTGSAMKYHNINVVYTKEAETADQYIEKLAHKIGGKYRVTVATSDGLEQLIIRSQGCLLLSAKDLKEEVEYVESLIAEEKVKLTTGPARSGKNYLLSHADEEMREYFEDIRLGKIKAEPEDAPKNGQNHKNKKKKK
ncbi:MAG: TetM/TetW/TetO/TetS family tetracycline resistance ribosomal protection protein [Lachnospiraceae bacterium]|nr:TetM/TetW/TetO/TetS family tetracycline resistance ribosomal protection protein [Lachnospiraceae bacterium]